MDSERKNLKEWSDLDKPREKAQNQGLAALSDSELLAILLRTGNASETAVELARKILNRVNNNLNALSRLTSHQLQNEFKGVGMTKAITILAALELGRRGALSQQEERAQIRCSEDIFMLFEPVVGHLDHEEFWILLLSHSHKVINRIRISQGGVSATVVDVKLIMKHALEELASSMVLCHNHPSGNLQASGEDVKVTLKVKEACSAMDITLLDHLIIGHKAYYSFADHNKL